MNKSVVLLIKLCFAFCKDGGDALHMVHVFNTGKQASAGSTLRPREGTQMPRSNLSL